LFSVEQRRLRDMIEVYEIMRGMDRASREQLFPLVEGSITRGQSFRVRDRRFRGDLRKNKRFHSEGGGNLECAAWESSGGRKPCNL